MKEQNESLLNNRGFLFVLAILILSCIVGYNWWYANNNYTQAFDDNFTVSCLNSGGGAAGCACLLGYIKSNYTFQENKRMEDDIRNGTTPEAYSRAVKHCS